MLAKEDAIADYSSTIGLNFIDNFSQSNAAFIIVTLKPFEERTDPSRGVQAVIARVAAAACAAARRPRGPGGAAADHRARHSGRLQLRAAGCARRRSEGARAGAARRPRRGEPGSVAVAGIQHILGEHPVDLSRYRSQQGAGARREAERRVPDATGRARQRVCERLQQIRPHLAGAGAGRGPGPRQR